MNRKRLELAAGILRDLGLAALVGGAGDLVVNRNSGRDAIDGWGIASGITLLLLAIYTIGVESRGRRK